MVLRELTAPQEPITALRRLDMARQEFVTALTEPVRTQQGLLMALRERGRWMEVLR